MKRFLLCFLILLACSCSKIESNLPEAPVYLRLDLRYEDKELVGTTKYKVYTAIRKPGEAVGISGILVVCGLDNNYYAFDLCCPHEAVKSIRLEPNDMCQAICPKCGTVYETGYGIGNPSSGVSKYSMKRYNITRSGQELLVSN